jgi:hypothetical protein
MSIVALAALAAAQAAAPQSAVKWVPLQGPQAPQAVVAAAPQTAVIAPAAGNVLRAGVEVPLQLEERLDSNDKTIREGQQFRMSVANNVMLGNAVVIPAGSPATGEITDLRHKGMWGKSGHISARVLNVRVGDRLIRLSGNFDEHGTTGTAGVVGAVVLLPIAGFFMTGTSAKIPVGAGVKAFLDEDLTLAMPAPPAPVAQIAAAQAVAAAPAASAPAALAHAAAAPAKR